MLDTNVLISATFWLGSSYKIVKKAENKEIELVLSLDILKEFSEVLNYEEIQKKIKNKIVIVVGGGRIARDYIDVLDKDGKILVQTFATAQGEWMTNDFVPFKGEVKVPESYIGPATLILRKDNASGLPEHDASVSFPFVIEY